MVLFRLVVVLLCFLASGTVWGESFRFAVLCDCRSDAESPTCMGNNGGISAVAPLAVGHILAKAAADPINLVLFPGDMIAGYLKRDAPSVSDCNRIQLTQWRTMMQPLMDAGTILRVTAGDHETRVLGESDLSDPCGKYFIKYSPATENFEVVRNVLWEMLGENQGPASDMGLTYSFDMGGCHFSVLNAYTMLHKNSFSEETLKWLESDLQKAAEAGQKSFVVSHPPVFPGSKHMWDALPFFDPTYNCDGYDGRYGIDRRREADRFWNILKKHNVTAYLCGHEHNIQVQEVEGVWHILSGGLTDKLYPLNGVAKTDWTNLILYDGRFQNPRASVIWPWDENKKSYWGWCLISVMEDRITMEVFGSDTRPRSVDDFKRLKSFVLWQK